MAVNPVVIDGTAMGYVVRHIHGVKRLGGHHSCGVPAAAAAPEVVLGPVLVSDNKTFPKIKLLSFGRVFL